MGETLSRAARPPVALALAALCAAAAGRAAPLDRGVSHFRLANGLDLVVAVRPELRLLAVNLTVDLGASDDPSEQSGMAHLLEHVTLSGSTTVGSLDPRAEAAALAALDAAYEDLQRERRRPAPDAGAVARLERRFDELQQAAERTAEPGEALSGRLESRGAIGLNATTTSDATQFFTLLPAGELELWLALEADRLRRPVFRRFYGERDLVLREIAGLTGGRPTLQERLAAELDPGGPAAQPVAGDPAEILAIDRPAALAYFHRAYRPENVAIAVVGDVDPEQVRRLCERHFGAWRPEGAGATAASRRQPPPAEPRRLRSFDGAAEAVAFFALPRPAGEAAALDALAELIGSPELSPLYRRLVDEQSLAWSVGAVPSFPSEAQPLVFLVHAYGNPGVAEQLLARQTAGLLAALALTPDADLEGAIRGAELRLAMQLDDPAALAATLALHQAVHGDWRLPFRRLAALQGLAAEEVRAAARELFGELAVAATAKAD